MQITVIGHGRVGGTLARVWADAGHDLRIGARSPGNADVQALATHDRIEATIIASAVQGAEAVLLAVPAPAGPDVAARIAGALDTPGNTVFIDATNAVGQRPAPYDTVADALADHLGTDRVVKAFNTTGFENMADPDYGDHALDMFMAGDSNAAKQRVAALAADAGFAVCYDVGDRSFFVSLEHVARVWISLALQQGHGRDIGWKILRRNPPS